MKDDKGHEVTVGSNGEVDITGWDYSSLQSTCDATSSSND
ncbi:RTX toxin [Vibrio cholerae]|nr:RTX toxin [Vibrio cholerae]